MTVSEDVISNNDAGIIRLGSYQDNSEKISLSPAYYSNFNTEENVESSDDGLIQVSSSNAKTSNKKSSSSSSASSDLGSAGTSTAGTGEQDIPKTQAELYGALQKVALDQPATKTVTYQYGERNPDFNENGIVDFPDFLMFAKNYGKTTGMADFDTRFDLVEDGTIGFSDFLKFAQDYGKKVEKESLQSILEILFSFTNPLLKTDFTEDSILIIPDIAKRIQIGPERISELAKPAIQKVESIDGKMKVLRYDSEKDEIVMTNNPGETGDYKLRIVVEAISENGDVIKKREVTISGHIYPLAKLSVEIVNSETKENEAGTFWIYDDEWNLLTTTTSNDDGSNAVGEDGIATVKFDVKESEFNKKLIVQGGIGVPETITTETNGVRTRLSDGYVRTVKEIKSGDDVLITAVPYGRYKDKPEDFLAYVIEQNGNPPKKFDFTGEYISKFVAENPHPDYNYLKDYDGLKKIIILKDDPFSSAFFTQEQQEYFKQ
ncbi:MAG: hypothetical protein KKB29_00865, partial [Nanoarchaeota archaeon]|nr:hypothetical protein [Nanoarchaeota archaeon]